LIDLARCCQTATIALRIGASLIWSNSFGMRGISITFR
jgi:hypothetical protein